MSDVFTEEEVIKENRILEEANAIRRRRIREISLDPREEFEKKIRGSLAQGIEKKLLHHALSRGFNNIKTSFYSKVFQTGYIPTEEFYTLEEAKDKKPTKEAPLRHLSVPQDIVAAWIITEDKETGAQIPQNNNADIFMKLNKQTLSKTDYNPTDRHLIVAIKKDINTGQYYFWNPNSINGPTRSEGIAERDLDYIIKNEIN